MTALNGALLRRTACGSSQKVPLVQPPEWPETQEVAVTLIKRGISQIEHVVRHPR